MTELENRKPIWEALSEFYLDVELGDEDFDRISQVFLASPYSLQELKKIDRYEVFPVLQANLLSAAGEWAAFDKERLHKNCQQMYETQDQFLNRNLRDLGNFLFYWMRKDYWRAIEYRLNQAK